MKFLHAADIHLDSPLAGLAARADLPPELVRDVTRRAFARMVDLAIAEDVAAGRLGPKPPRVFRFEEIREAHRVMEANEAGGKMVVVRD